MLTGIAKVGGLFLRLLFANVRKRDEASSELCLEYGRMACTLLAFLSGCPDKESCPRACVTLL